MTRPRLLDLFCKAGGCAVGYHRAGFDVTGVDIEPQPRFPFRFVQADALEYLAQHGTDFDAIHASPPCQRYANVTAWRGTPGDHPALVDETRRLLELSGRPWVIENVPGAPLASSSDLFGQHGVMICGTMVGLPIRRHRLFEASFALQPAGRCNHAATDYAFDHGGKQPESVYRDALGCEWMSVIESRQAIPPAYTQFIGNQLMEIVRCLTTQPIGACTVPPSSRNPASRVTAGPRSTTS